MTFPAFIYKHEPSKALSSHGDIVEDSYYFVENGRLLLEDKRELQCKFEVAHMQNGQSWLIVYFQVFESHKDIQFIKQHAMIDLVFFGKDASIGSTVQVYTSQLVSENTTMGSGSGMRMEFVARRYEVSSNETDIEVRFVEFYVSNLPLALPYKPSTYEGFRLELERDRHSAELEAAITSAIQNRQTDISDDELRKRIEAHIEKAGESATNEGMSLGVAEYIPINIDNVEVGKLFWKRSYDDRDYDGQPLCRLVIDVEKIADDWGFEEVASWICRLFSLSLGRDVNFNYYLIRDFGHEYFFPQRVWISNSISGVSFNAFTEDQGYFRATIGLSADSNSLKFVTDTMSYVLNLPKHHRIKYHEALLTYARYASSIVSTYEQRCTLLCALGEYIYSAWESVAGAKYVHHLEKSERRVILNEMIEVLRKHKNKLIPKMKNESDLEYEKRVESELNDYKSGLGHGLSGTLKDQFEWLLRKNGWNLDDGDESYFYTKHRVKKFVKSRHKLFHEHRFSTPRDAKHWGKEVGREIENIQTFIPLLLATVLHYEGQYWHPLAGNVRGSWEWMPQNRIISPA